MFIWKSKKNKEEIFDALKQDTFPDVPMQILQNYHEFDPWEYHAFLYGKSGSFSIRLSNKRIRNSFRKSLYVKIKDSPDGCEIIGKLQYHTFIRFYLYWFFIIFSLLVVMWFISIFLGQKFDAFASEILSVILIWLCIVPALYLSRKSKGASKPKNDLDKKLLGMVSKAANADYQD